MSLQDTLVRLAGMARPDGLRIAGRLGVADEPPRGGWGPAARWAQRIHTQQMGEQLQSEIEAAGAPRLGPGR